MNPAAPSPAPGHAPLPTVSVVIATLGERAELLRGAVASIFAQEAKDGRRWPVEVIVVFDHRPVQRLEDVEVPEGSRLLTIANQRSRGLAGGRNSGILAASGEIVGFCDDDDAWLPGKLAAQVPLLQEEPAAMAVSGGLVVRTDGKDVLFDTPARVDFADLLRSRVQQLHPSGVMYRRADLLGGLGLVDEELPHGYGEDYDMLLRAARAGCIVSTPTPVVRVLWDRPSYFAGKWVSIAEGLEYLLRKFPEFESEPVGVARIAGQVAYARAALGEGKLSRAWARSALRRDPKQLRAWASLAVGTRLIKAERLVELVQRTGRGL